MAERQEQARLLRRRGRAGFERQCSRQQHRGGASVVADDDSEARKPAFDPRIDEHKFHVALARVFYTCALPFLLVEDTAFKALFGMVAPGLKASDTPSTLRSAAATRSHGEQKRVLAAVRQQRFVPIVTDGWADQNDNSIINFMVVAPGMLSAFWSSIPTGSSRHTAEYLAHELGRVIDEVQQETGAVIAGAMSDNANNVAASRQLLQRGRAIFSGGCAAHVLNLLIQDVVSAVELVREVRVHVITVVRFVRDHLALLDKLRALQ